MCNPARFHRLRFRPGFALGVESEQRQPKRVNALKMWPWNKILVSVGWFLLVAGVTPGAYILVRLGNAHNQKPLSVPVSLKQGEFTSPAFTTDSSGEYLIDVNWDLIPARQTTVDLDWKVVADGGQVVAQGGFNNVLRGANTIRLGRYTPNPGQHEQIVLNVHADVDQGGAKATLAIGPKDTATSFSEAIPFAARWSMFLAIPGALLLILAMIVDAFRRKRPDA